MQAGGQYGVSEVQQFMVGRPGSGGHAHMFSLSHDVVAAVSPSSHSHSHHSQQQQAHHQIAASQTSALQQQQQNHQSQHHQQQQQHMMQQQQQLQQQQQQHHLGLDPDSPNLPSPVAARQSPNSYNKQLALTRDSLAADDEGMEEVERSIGGNRWPRQETLALIKIRTEMDASFRDAGLKGPLWEDVSRKLGELDFHRSAKKCKEKFENVHKYYKKTKEGKAGRQDGKSYRFFSQLEALYGGHGGGGRMATSKGGGNNGGNSSRAPKAAGGGGGSFLANMSAQRFSEQIDEFNISSESSEDEYDVDPSAAAEEEEEEEAVDEGKKKRKRKASWSSYEVGMLEGLVRKMMEKQEEMQRKFVEMIERREQERVIRESAWRRQEMARISHEQELRAQERSLAASRDAALVAFLQKVTGQTLQLPHCIPTAPPATSAPPSHHPPSSAQHHEPQFDIDQLQEKECHMQVDPNSKRWPRSEVLSLIRLRSGMEAKFQESGPKGPLWEAISAAMASLGYSRSPKRCKEKWENINKYFRKTKESSKKRPENAKTCPYFHQLDALYKTGVLNSPTGKQQLAPKLEAQTNEILDHDDRLAREDSGQAQEEDQMLGLIPSSAEDASNGIALNGSSSSAAAAAAAASAPPMFTALKESGTSLVDRSVNNAAKMDQKQNAVDDGSGMSFERFSGHEKPLKQLEGLVKEMMEQQQQQQQQSSDDFELSVDQTQAENKSHDQWQQQQDHFKLRSSAHDRARSNPKDAALIALVHKLAGQAPEHFPSISDLST